MTTIDRDANGLARGWEPIPVTREITPDPETWPMLAPDPAREPLRATIRDDLTFAEIDAIVAPSEGARWNALWASIAPYVLTWNVRGINPTTREREPLPPPANAGPSVFAAAPKYVAIWLAIELKFGHLRDLPKSPRPTSATLVGPNATDADSPTPAANRPNPRTTISPAGSTSDH